MDFIFNKFSEKQLKKFHEIDLFSNKYSEEDLNILEECFSFYDWRTISENQNLSENFIKKFKDKVNWYYISRCQILSENFIREFQDMVHWNNISISQSLSEEFIREFKNKISWSHLRWNTKIQVSDEFTIEFDEKLERINEWLINGNPHRILGPARIYNDKKEYYYRGKLINVNSNEEYFEWLKYKDF